jgi:hypothetical protein
MYENPTSRRSGCRVARGRVCESLASSLEARLYSVWLFDGEIIHAEVRGECHVVGDAELYADGLSRERAAEGGFALLGLLRVEAASIVFAIDMDVLTHLEESGAQAHADAIL